MRSVEDPNTETLGRSTYGIDKASLRTYEPLVIALQHFAQPTGLNTSLPPTLIPSTLSTSRKRARTSLHETSYSPLDHHYPAELERSMSTSTSDEALASLTPAVWDEVTFDVGALDFEQFCSNDMGEPYLVDQDGINTCPSSLGTTHITPLMGIEKGGSGRQPNEKPSPWQIEPSWRQLMPELSRERDDLDDRSIGSGTLSSVEAINITPPDQQVPLPDLSPPACIIVDPDQPDYEDHLYRLYRQLKNYNATSGSKARPSLADAFQHTMTLICIVRKAATISKLEASNGAERERQDSGFAATSAPRSSDAQTHPPSLHSDLNASPKFRMEDSSSIHANDPIIRFLVLGCYFHMVRLYMRLLENVMETLIDATKSGPESPEQRLNDCTVGSSAMEWVQTASSVVHLAEKLDSAMGLLATKNRDQSDNSADDIGPVGSRLPDIGGSTVDVERHLNLLIVEPIRQVCEMRRRLSSRAIEVTRKIRETDLI